MNKEQHRIINAVCIYTALFTAVCISIIIASGIFKLHDKTFVTDSVIEAMLTLLGVNILGMVGLIIRWLFKE